MIITIKWYVASRPHWVQKSKSWFGQPDKTRYVDGTPTSEVTPVTIRYICPPHHGHTSQYHSHEWMTHILLVPSQSASAQARAGADGLREAGAFYLHNPRGSPITGIGSFAKSPWRRRPKFCCFRSLRCRVRTLGNFHVRPPSSTRGTSRHIASTATDGACQVGLFHFTHIPPEMAKRTLNRNHHLGFTLCSLILVTLYFASISNVTHTTWTCYNSLITTEDEQYRLAVVNNTTDLATRKPIVCPLFIPYKSIKRNVVPRDCKQSRFCIIYFMLLLSGNIELNPGPGQASHALNTTAGKAVWVFVPGGL